MDERRIAIEEVEPSGETFSFGNVNSRYGADGRCFSRDGKPWIPVVGEFHFSRYKRFLWERELRKIKAQGLDGVAVYVFWDHHEYRRGRFDFSGDNDIREFLRLCRSLALVAVLRIGPWCHGEVRFGGFPDYVAVMPGARTNFAPYLKCVKRYWSKLFEQVKDFCDGETVLGIQLENEYTGSIDHIVRLRELAEAVGFKTPFFTMTAWPTNTPDRRFLPMFGGYPEAPWTQNKRPLEPARRFAILAQRGEAEIGEDLIKTKKEKADFSAFPYATCETGTGNQVTHHRRPVISDRDGYGIAFAHFASGVNWLGYYMYHGGRNPLPGKPMQESRRTFYPNNYPVKDYDFQAPISKDGEVRAHGHRLRLLHYFIKSDEEFLAQSGVFFASGWEKPFVSVRGNKERGYVFVSNYERGEKARDTQIALDLGANAQLPPIQVKAGDMFFFPFGCTYGKEKFDYIFAQPVCATKEEGRHVYWFVKYGDKVKLSHGGKERVVDDKYCVEGAELRFLTLEEAERFYLTAEGAVFSDGPIFEKDGQIFAELKAGQSATFCGKTITCGESAPTAALNRTGAQKLKFNSYMPLFAERAYYELVVPKFGQECDDVEVTLSFGGLDLQMFEDGKLVDDCFNTDGAYVFRMSGVTDKRQGRFMIRVCAPTKRGGGNVYNEIGLVAGDTALKVEKTRAVKTVCLGKGERKDD